MQGVNPQLQSRIYLTSLPQPSYMVMDWWVYKCNARNNSYQRAVGNWNDLLDKRDGKWGSTEWIPALNRLKRGDFVLGYQTDRNEVVLAARVRQSAKADTFVYLEPIQELRFKVRPLKKSNAKIEAIPAFRPGPIATLYSITKSDVVRLLRAAGVDTSQWGSDLPNITPKAPISEKEEARVRACLSSGFGLPENNRKVERAAICATRRRFEKRGWKVKSVESDRCGYDLDCEKGKNRLHVEVKGTGGNSTGFIITAGEWNRSQSDPQFRLSLVCNALGAAEIEVFNGAEVRKQFARAPLAWKATRKTELRRNCATAC